MPTSAFLPVTARGTFHSSKPSVSLSSWFSNGIGDAVYRWRAADCFWPVLGSQASPDPLYGKSLPFLHPRDKYDPPQGANVSYSAGTRTRGRPTAESQIAPTGGLSTTTNTSSLPSSVCEDPAATRPGSSGSGGGYQDVGGGCRARRLPTAAGGLPSRRVRRHGCRWEAWGLHLMHPAQGIGRPPSTRPAVPAVNGPRENKTEGTHHRVRDSLLVQPPASLIWEGQRRSLRVGTRGPQESSRTQATAPLCPHRGQVVGEAVSTTFCPTRDKVRSRDGQLITLCRSL